MSKEQEFMNKVLDQILSETSMDCGQQMVFTPFMSFSVSFPLSPINPSLLLSYVTECFVKHCKDVYSLKKNSDIDYIWKEYVNIINKKLNKELV